MRHCFWASGRNLGVPDGEGKILSLRVYESGSQYLPMKNGYRRTHQVIAASVPTRQSCIPLNPIAVQKLTKRRSDRTLESALVAQDILLSGIIQILINARLSRKTIAQRLQALAATLESGQPLKVTHSDDYDSFARVSGVVHDWTRSPDYTGNNGEPIPLALKGRRSVSVLIGRRVSRRDVLRTLQWMIARRIVRCRKDGCYVLRRRAVLVGNPDPVYLEWAATVAVQHLRTAFENWKERNPRARQLDRIARVFNLPTKDVSKFQVFAKDRAERWLEEIDNWLEDRNAPNADRHKVEAGVHVYGYVIAPRKLRTRRSVVIAQGRI